MGSKNYRLLIIFCLLAFVWNGCKPDEEVLPDTFTGAKVLIANEGNFGWGEGTLSVYYEGSETIDNEVYKAKNKESLGNVFHSITSLKGYYFLVINNSGKIVITDSSFNKVKEITGLTSPRNIYQVTDDKAYITDLYANAIHVMNIKTLEITGAIPCNGHSEEGVISQGKFWFTAPETSNIYAVDISRDEIVDSTQVGVMPESIVLDKDLGIWVMCRGRGVGKLVALDPSGSIDMSFSYEVTGVPTNLVYDDLLDVFYYLNTDICILDRSVSSDPSIWKSAENKVFYSLNINPSNNDVYVSDVKDFVSRSTIYRYSREGALLDDFSAGIIAGDFFFP